MLAPLTMAAPEIGLGCLELRPGSTVVIVVVTCGSSKNVVSL